MSIIINKNTKAIIQGITGHHGSFHTKVMLDYGTKIIAGVTPNKGGLKVHGLPVFGSVNEAIMYSKKEGHKIEWSMLFVPALNAKEAAHEALQNGLNIIILTEHIPIYDVLEIINYAKKKKRIVIGPNSPGLINPGECKLGIMPHKIFTKNKENKKIGVVSRSGTLTYEIVNELTKAGYGQSTCIGIGGDPILGTDFIDILKQFEQDKETKQIVMVGEIGGDAEEKAAKFIKKNIKKKVVAYIAGKCAPKGKRMGHAGAIISGTEGTYEAKIKALVKSRVEVAEHPSEIIRLLNK